jgi:hypothetical protein
VSKISLTDLRATETFPGHVLGQQTARFWNSHWCKHAHLDCDADPAARQESDRPLSAHAARQGAKRGENRACYRAKYGISNVSIPIVCTSYPGLLSIFEVIKRECSPSIAERFLGKVIPDFTSMEPFAAPTGHMFTEDWLRPDRSRFNIEAFMQTGENTWTSREPRSSLHSTSESMLN